LKVCGGVDGDNDQKADENLRIWPDQGQIFLYKLTGNKG